MAMSKGKRWAVAAGGVLLALIVVAVGGLQLVQREVKARVIADLGPLGSAESIDVGLTSVRLTNVLLKAPPGWPAGDPLRADEITHHTRHSRSDRDGACIFAAWWCAVSIWPCCARKDGTIRLLPESARVGESRPMHRRAVAVAPTSQEKQVDHISFEQGNFPFL